jgi:hypothetical protein
MRRKEEEELKQTIAEMRRRKEDTMEHYEGEIDVEDIFDTPIADFEEIVAEQPVKKKPKK